MLSTPSHELDTVIRDLSSRLESLRTCNDLVTKHGLALQRALSDLENNSGEDLIVRTKTITERATIFRISSNAMMKVSGHFQLEKQTSCTHLVLNNFRSIFVRLVAIIYTQQKVKVTNGQK